MSIKLFIDVNVSAAITDGLRLRGVDVLTAQEDGTRTMPDDELMTRSGVLGRVMFSHDKDMLIEAARRQATNEYFSGLVYVHQLSISIGQAIADLEIIAKVYEYSDIENDVRYLPL